MNASLRYSREWGADGAPRWVESLLAVLAVATVGLTALLGARLLCPHLGFADLAPSVGPAAVTGGFLLIAPVLLAARGRGCWRRRLPLATAVSLAHLTVGVGVPAFGATGVIAPDEMLLTLGAATSYACAVLGFLDPIRHPVGGRRAALALATGAFALHAPLGGGVAIAALLGSTVVIAPALYVVTRAALLDHLEAEAVCLWEMYHFSRRHLRYLLIGLYIYPGSLLAWRRRQMMRVGFCLLQHVDDILDGDRPCDREPLEVVDELIYQLETERFRYDALGILARQLLKTFDQYTSPEDRTYEELLRLLRIMQRDRQRVLHQQTLCASELREHLQDTFYYSVSVLLVYSGAELRADHAGHLIDALAWCSVMRDLEEDQEKGLDNIPREVWDQASLDPRAAPALSELLQQPAIQRWMAEEYSRGLEALDASEAQLAGLKGSDGFVQLNIFQKSVRKFAEKLPRKYPFLRSPPASGRIEASEAVST